jgi:hypothetical protein
MENMPKMKINRIRKSALVISFCIMLCFISTGNLFAAEKSPELETVKLNLGAFIPFFNSELRVDSPTLGRGTNLDLEDRLGLDEEITEFRVDGYLRFFDRHRLQLGYYNISRSARAQLTDPIQFGDTIFPAIAVNTDTDISIYEASYMFSFLQNDSLELAASLGAQTLDIEASITGSGGLLRESADVVGPVPVIGLDLNYRFTQELFLVSRIQFFTYEFEEYDGTLIDFRAALEYMFFENFGLGIGYNYFDIDIDIDGSNFLGVVNYEFQGVQVFGVIRF